MTLIFKEIGITKHSTQVFVSKFYGFRKLVNSFKDMYLS